MGLSRDTFYRYRDAVEEGGVEALLERTRRVPNPKNRVDPETENAVVAYAVEYPAHGQVRVSNELRKRGVFVSASGVQAGIEGVADRAITRNAIIDLKVPVAVPGQRGNTVSALDPQPGERICQTLRAQVRVGVAVAMQRPFDAPTDNFLVCVNLGAMTQY
jgi:hypothetical protein